MNLYVERSELEDKEKESKEAQKLKMRKQNWQESTRSALWREEIVVWENHLVASEP